MSHRVEVQAPVEIDRREPSIAVIGMGKVGKAFGRPDTPVKITALTRNPIPTETTQSLQLEDNVTGFDITAPPEVLAAKLRILKQNGVRTVVNAAGIIGINQDIENQRSVIDTLKEESGDGAIDETRAPDAYKANVFGARNLAIACHEAGIQLIHLSTESVFGNDRAEKYKEEDAPDVSKPYFRLKHTGLVHPAVEHEDIADDDLGSERAFSAYGHFKLDSERAVLDNNPDAIVIRIGGLQAKTGGLFATIAKQLQGSTEFTKPDDLWTTHLTDVMTRDAILAAERGMHEKTLTERVFHVSGSENEPLTPLDMTAVMAERLAERGIEVVRFRPVRQRELEHELGMVPRSRHVMLDTGRFSEQVAPLPTTVEAIGHWVDLHVAPKTQK